MLAASIEAHLMSCADCRALLGSLTDRSAREEGWQLLADVVDLIVPFKRPVYEQVVKKFKKFARDAS